MPFRTVLYKILSCSNLPSVYMEFVRYCLELMQIPMSFPSRIPASRCGVNSVRGVNPISLVSTLLRLRPQPLIKPLVRRNSAVLEINRAVLIQVLLNQERRCYLPASAGISSADRTVPKYTLYVSANSPGAQLNAVSRGTSTAPSSGLGLAANSFQFPKSEGT